MIVKKKDFLKLVQEEVKRQEKKQFLAERIQLIEQELNSLNEFVDATAPQTQTAAQQPNFADTGNNTNLGQQNAAPQQNAGTEVDEEESIFDARPGETVIFNFQDVTIKLQRQLDDLFKVVDAAESQKLKDGDYIKVQGNDLMKKGRKFTFVIFRAIDNRYESNALNTWRIIKNR